MSIAANKPVLALIRFIIILMVPITSQLAIALHWPALRIIAVLLLVIGLFLPRLQKLSYCAALTIITGVLLYFPVIADAVLIALPSIVMIAIGSLFAWSLKPGKTPLVAAMATAIRRETRPAEVLPAKIFRYCRAVTWLWALVLFSMAAINFLLAFYGTQQQWSTFANVGTPLIIGPLFLVEFLVRSWWLREFWHPNFREFIAGLRRLNYQQLLK